MAGAEVARLTDRAARLSAILDGLDVVHDRPLMKAVRLPDNSLEALRGAAANYVWYSLCQAFPERTVALSLDILGTASSLIDELPNLTPNGVLLPKWETFVAFNQILRILYQTVGGLGLADAFSAFQMPCNVRIVDGEAAESTDERPYSSAKVHSDVWNGEPENAFLFNIPLLGDPETVGMKFFAPRAFPRDLIRRLDDYREGAPVVDAVEDYDIPFSVGCLYLSDALSLHRTDRRGSGKRLSIDFRALAAAPVADEVVSLADSRAEYVPWRSWQDAGLSSVLASDEPMDSFARRARGEHAARKKIAITFLKAVE